MEVLTLAELYIEDIVVDSSKIFEGDVVPVRIYVRNSGNSEASLISVRCQSGDTLVGIKSIVMLKSGELGVVTCDWKQTDSGTKSLTVELDRVNEILESDESNNIGTITIEVSQSNSDDSSSNSLISTSTLWIFTFVIIALVIVLFSAFAPGKIKKL